MHSPFLPNKDLWPWRWSDLFIRFKNPERYSIILSNWSGWEVAGGDEERNSTDHRWRDGRVSSIGSARYHICVGSERDDSVYASCRGEQWIAELHIDSRAVRGGLVLSLSPSLTWALSLSLHLSWIQLDACGSPFLTVTQTVCLIGDRLLNCSRQKTLIMFKLSLSWQDHCPKFLVS